MRAPSLAPRRVALVGGYTAGHIMPMLAVGEAYAEHSPQARIIALGQRNGLEASLLPAHGFVFHAIDAAPYFGARGPRGLLRATRSLYTGFRTARELLAAAGTEVVIGFGGYVTAGTLLAARSLGLLTVLFEANVIPGRANRLLKRYAHLCCVGQAETRRFPGWGAAIVTGHPVRAEIARLELGRDGARSAKAPQVLVTGGSLGSAFLDRMCPGLFARLAENGRSVSVRHQTCAARVDVVTDAYARAGVDANVEAFSDMARAYGGADFVVCAGGAGTLAEIEALGLPALVVPIAGTADAHQIANAEAFAARSGRPWISESAWTEAGAARLLLDGLAHRYAPQREHIAAAGAVVELCERSMAARRSASGLAAPPFKERPT